MDMEIENWRRILPKDPTKMNWQEWQTLLNSMTRHELGQYWPGVRKDLIPDYTVFRVTGQDETDPYAGLTNKDRPASHQLPDPTAKTRTTYQNKFTQGYQPPEVNKVGFFAKDKKIGGYNDSYRTSSNDLQIVQAVPVGELPRVIDEISADPESAYYETLLSMIAQGGRIAGYDVAADHLEHFLEGSGTEIHVSFKWLLSRGPVSGAMNALLDRVQKRVFDIGSELHIGQSFEFGLPLDVSVVATRDVDPGLYYASQGSTIDADPILNITKISDIEIEIIGDINFKWYDKYDWGVGKSAEIGFGPFVVEWKDEYADHLVKANRAADFRMSSSWYFKVNIVRAQLSDVNEGVFEMLFWANQKLE